MAFTYWYTGIPEGGLYTKKVSVQANTTEEAISAVRRIHGIQDPVFYGTSGGESDGGGIDLGTSTIAGLILVGIVAFFTLLPYIIVVGAIGLMGWGLYKLVKWILK